MATIYGTSGDDSWETALFGTDANDTFYGYGGMNWYNGSAGSDTFIGGADLDVVIYGNESPLGPLVINDTSVARFGAAAFTTVKPGGAIDSLVGIEAVHGTGFDDIILLEGTGYVFDESGNDRVYLYGAATALNSEGNDTIIGTGEAWLRFKEGTQGAIVVLTGAGAGYVPVDAFGFSDVFRGIYAIAGTRFEDSLFGAGGADQLFGEDGNDLLSAGAGNDYLDGGAGADTLQAGAGQDTLTGGAGNDTYVYTGEGAAQIFDTEGATTIAVQLDTRNPLLQLFYDAGGRLIVQAQDGSSLTVETPNIISTLEWHSASPDWQDYAIPFADVAIGTQGSDSLTTSSAGYVEAYGADGGDTITVRGQSSWVSGDGGSDQLNGGNGADWLYGDFRAPAFGSDTILGNGGDDVLSGDGGNDRLDGGSGNDVLDGGSSTDTMQGGTGNDTFVVDTTSDLVSEAASAGTDLVQAQITYVLPTNVENLTLIGAAAINGTGNSAANLLTGNSGANSLSGGSGNDTLLGAGGKDSLTGGSGNDRFVFLALSDGSPSDAAADIVTDLVQGQDKIDLAAIDAFTASAPNDAFLWRGTSAFTSTTQGEVRFQKVDNSGTANDYTMVFVDTDADAGIELAIRLTGLYTLTAADFLL